jgi:hypothetical protein
MGERENPEWRSAIIRLLSNEEGGEYGGYVQITPVDLKVMPAISTSLQEAKVMPIEIVPVDEYVAIRLTSLSVDECGVEFRCSRREPFVSSLLGMRCPVLQKREGYRGRFLLCEAAA